MRRTRSTGTGSNRSGAIESVAAAAAAAEEEEELEELEEPEEAQLEEAELEEAELEEAELEEEEAEQEREEQRKEDGDAPARAFFLGGGMRSVGDDVEARVERPGGRRPRAVDRRAVDGRCAAPARRPPARRSAGGDLGGRAAGPPGRVRGRGPALWGRGRSGWCCGGRRGVGAGVDVSRGGGVAAAVLRRSSGGAEWPRGGKSAAQLVFYMQIR